MTPDTFKLLVDVLSISVGIIAIVYARKSAVGGIFGAGMNLILFGIFILALNHLLDSVYLANALKMAGHTNDYLQGPIVHRLINLFGFIMVTLGFMTFNKSGR